MRLNADEQRGLLYVALAVGVFATSPILVRFAAPIPSVQITFGRMAVGALTVLIAAQVLRRPVHLPRGDMRRFVLYGLVTALHFLLYIASLSFTTIAHSLSIIYTAPIFIAILSAVFLGEPIARRKYIGIVIAVAGVAILAGFEPHADSRMLFGDLLALGSALCFGFYSVFGRSQRERYPLLTYAAVVYGMAALWMAPAALLAPQPAYTPLSILAVILLGVFPSGVAHTLYNAAIRKVHAAYANLIATQEVTGGVILGILILGETPSPSALVGAAIALLGIIIVLLWE